jgi:hypothetical protein
MPHEKAVAPAAESVILWVDEYVFDNPMTGNLEKLGSPSPK